MTQAYIQAAVRFIVVMGCAGFICFALQMSETPPKDALFLCDARTLSCYDQLGRR